MSNAIPAQNDTAPATLPGDTRRKVTEIFTRDEIRMLTARSDIRGFIAVCFTWLTIGLCFVALAWASTQSLLVFVPVFLLALCILGGRQLSLAIQMHDASHGSLFKHKWLNHVFADWVCARPIWNDLHKYRAHHIIHHTHTGQDIDSDLSLVAAFPTTRASLARKLLRDAVGITGVKFFIGRFLMDAGYIKWTVANDVERLPRDGMTLPRRLAMLVRNVTPTLIVNGILFAVLWAAGHPWLFLVWILAYMTTFSVFVRIRSMAEHACTQRSPDMFLNTRTTRAGLLARATVAPLNVNYHIEHHVMASVPYFRLPLMHRMLRERGAVAAPPGYLDVLRLVSSRKAAEAG
ncbi:MAG: fatty acid desaturase family protein [Alcanivorax sp.]|nr:fatty acid desaturase family protein [Alcanivorax sp.]